MFVKELLRNHPCCIRNNLINPSAMSKRFIALFLIQHSLALVFVGSLIITTPNKQIGIRKQFLGLLKRAGMTVMKEIVNAVCINPNWSAIRIEIVTAGCVLVVLLPFRHCSFAPVHSPVLLCSFRKM
uniref:Uncharacterized protein n=1 Tax=Opuntia streptacantha TaxID=393608 RepID=A0A7C9DGB0_OPUST